MPKAPKSSLRDGWGILLNAVSHLRPDDTAAIELLTAVRINNFYAFSLEWARGRSAN